MKATVLVLALVVAAGCGDAGSVREVSTQDPQLVEEGQVLYTQNCADCHGQDLRGTDQGPSFLSPIYEPGHHGDGAFLLAVQNGVRAHHWQFGDMPPVESITADEVEAIIAYVRETQRREGFEP